MPNNKQHHLRFLSQLSFATLLQSFAAQMALCVRYLSSSKILAEQSATVVSERERVEQLRRTSSWDGMKMFTSWDKRVGTFQTHAWRNACTVFSREVYPCLTTWKGYSSPEMIISVAHAPDMKHPIEYSENIVQLMVGKKTFLFEHYCSWKLLIYSTATEKSFIVIELMSGVNLKIQWKHR